jgi:salicylate hydroxylase
MPATGAECEIAIAGAGIAGLTTALCLARAGQASTVFERAPEFHEIGAGIQLSPNAMHVLAGLGLDEAVMRRANEPEAIDIRDGPTGALLTSIPLRRLCRTRYGAPYLAVHRADLMQVLLGAAQSDPLISIRTGSPVERIEAGGANVRFTAGDETFAAGILLAADGVHSEIRKAVTGQLEASLGKTAWRATLYEPDYDEVVSAERTGLWFGRSAHMVHYPLRGGRELNLVLIGDAEAESPHFLLDHFERHVRGIAGAAQWVPWPLLHVPSDSAWTSGRVAMLGDAAHAMLPTSAQGGAQAIEDAAVLADSIVVISRGPSPDLARALSGWELRRKPRVRRIARQARRNLEVYTMHGLGVAARNLAIRLIPGDRHLARLDWLYGWRPPADG